MTLRVGLTHPALAQELKLTWMDYLLTMLRNRLRRKRSYDTPPTASSGAMSDISSVRLRERGSCGSGGGSGVEIDQEGRHWPSSESGTRPENERHGDAWRGGGSSVRYIVGYIA